MSVDKIFEEISIAFVKLDKFKYTYREFNEFYETIKKTEKERKKTEKDKKKNSHKNIELDNYRTFILHYRNKGVDIKTTLELWNNHINKKKIKIDL